MKHPECPHPVTNASDDYSGIQCCCCDGNPCSAVTPEMFAAHNIFLAWLEDGAA